MLLTQNQTAQLLMTYRSAIAAARLVYSATTLKLSTAKSVLALVNQYFILPAVDHMWGNACDWQDTLTKGWKHCKPVLTDVFILLPFLLGCLARESADRFVESCLDKTLETTGLHTSVLFESAESLEVETIGIDRAIPGSDKTVQVAMTYTCESMQITEVTESHVNQTFQPITDYSSMKIAALRQLARGKMPKASRANKAAIIAVLMQQ